MMQEDPIPTSPVDISANTPPSKSKNLPKKYSKKEARQNLKSIALMIVGSVVFSALILTFVFRTYNVNGSSMYPTLHNKDKVVVNKLSKTKSGGGYIPHRGQIVVFNSEKEAKSLIKRVIALPGEKVSMQNGTFTVKNEQYPNGFDPDSPYKDSLPKTDGTSFAEMEVPVGHIFVSGDNRAPGQSLDSRNQLGFVPLSEVVGTAWSRYWPLEDAKRFE